MKITDEAMDISKHMSDYLPKPRIEVEIDTAELEAVIEKIEKLTDRVEKVVARLDVLSKTIEE